MGNLKSTEWLPTSCAGGGAGTHSVEVSRGSDGLNFCQFSGASDGGFVLRRANRGRCCDDDSCPAFLLEGIVMLQDGANLWIEVADILNAAFTRVTTRQHEYILIKKMVTP